MTPVNGAGAMVPVFIPPTKANEYLRLLSVDIERVDFWELGRTKWQNDTAVYRRPTANSRRQEKQL